MSFFGMTKILLTSLFRRPATRLYPFEVRAPYPATRGSIGITVEKCILCGICMKKCPAMAIQVDKPSRRWAIDRLRCVACNYCVDVCPTKCLTMKPEYAAPTVTRDTEPFTIPPPAPKPAAG